MIKEIRIAPIKQKLMNRIKIIPLVLIILISGSTSFAVDGPPVLARIEARIKEKEPQWRLSSKRSSGRDIFTLFVWTSGAESVGALVMINSSREKAADSLDGLASTLGVSGLGMTKIGSVPNLGDENYEWKDSDHKGVFGVDFRRGNVVVHVKASTLERAKTFAEYIDDVIPTE